MHGSPAITDACQEWRERIHHCSVDALSSSNKGPSQDHVHAHVQACACSARVASVAPALGMRPDAFELGKFYRWAHTMPTACLHSSQSHPKML